MKIHVLHPKLMQPCSNIHGMQVRCKKLKLKKYESPTPPMMIIPTLYGLSFLKETSILVLIGSLDAHFP
jgi:hypothetical protein